MASDGSLRATPRRPRGVFLPPIVVPPLSPTHNLTVIFLHGRGSNALKFHSPLLSSPISSSSSSSPSSSPSSTTTDTLSSTPLTFHQALPTARFVFPTAPLSRANKYRRSIIHQWYEGSGDWEPESRGDMRPSVEHIRGILREEIEKLGGDAGRVVLAGISQGCAMALMSLLLWEGEPLGAVVVMCGFMPLASHLLSILENPKDTSDQDDMVIFEIDSDDEQEMKSPLQQVVDDLREEAELEPVQPSETRLSFLSTPVFMGHGTEDDNVEYQYGEQAYDVLEKMGVLVNFHSYEGLGHWYSPEMLGDIVEFLKEKLEL
ncbi:Alpha/Beta hydrolase protein [Mariannaea sp. PMI_226]|nr:Alpha/Beta hydrolase protein [Mariannaea sp. PMI_226]